MDGQGRSVNRGALAVGGGLNENKRIAGEGLLTEAP